MIVLVTDIERYRTSLKKSLCMVEGPPAFASCADLVTAEMARGFTVFDQSIKRYSSHKL